MLQDYFCYFEMFLALKTFLDFDIIPHIFAADILLFQVLFCKLYISLMTWCSVLEPSHITFEIIFNDLVLC